MPLCSILKCRARKKENQPKLSVHRIPKNEGLRKKWLEAIGEENINPRHKEQYICSEHFEDGCFNRTLDVMRLRDNSVPTKFLASNKKKIQEPSVWCETSYNKKSDNCCTSTVMPPLQLPHQILETAHKELQNDMENDEYTTTGEVACLHASTSTSTDICRPTAAKKQRLTLINEYEEEIGTAAGFEQSENLNIEVPCQDEDSESEENTLSNLAASWKSATREVQRGDQHESDRPALSDAVLPNAGSRGDLNIPESSPPSQINLHTAQMCRVCLALDVRMFDLRDTELRTMFQSTTGISFKEKKGSKLGSLICWQCAARLKAASTFKNKALFSDSLLQGLINKGDQIIKKIYFETVKEEADVLISPKTLTVTDVYHIVETDGDDGDELSQSESIETEENMLDEIKEQIKDNNSVIDVEGDSNFAINTEIEDDPTCYYTEEVSRTNLIEETLLASSSTIEQTINSGYSPLLDIGHTSVRSDLISSQEDYDDQISKNVIQFITRSNIVPKQNKLKYHNKILKQAVSHDHVYYFKGDSKHVNKKKKFKKK